MVARWFLEVSSFHAYRKMKFKKSQVQAKPLKLTPVDLTWAMYPQVDHTGPPLASLSHRLTL